MGNCAGMCLTTQPAGMQAGETGDQAQFQKAQQENMNNQLAQ